MPLPNPKAVIITRNMVIAGQRGLKLENRLSLMSPPIRVQVTAPQLRHRAGIKLTLPLGASMPERWAHRLFASYARSYGGRHSAHPRVIDKIEAGDIPGAMPKAPTRWAALPEGPAKANHHPPQPYVEYSAFLANYKSAVGPVK